MLARAHARAPILAHRHSPKTWNRSTATARRATTRGRRVVCSASDAEPAGETIVASSVSGGSPDDPLANFRDGDLLLLRVDGSEEDDATKLASKPLLDREWFFEVVGDEAQLSQTTPSVQETDETSEETSDATKHETRPHETRRSLVGLCRGVAAFLTWSAEDGEIRMVPVAERDVGERSRCSPRLAEREWVKASFPAWHALLSDLESTGEYPRDPRSVLRSFRDGSIDKSSIARVEKVTDYDALRSTVRADPSYWCDGAPAEFVETDPKRQATNNAGELLALLEGHRGVVMTQLWAGWEDSDSQQPVDAPFALRALRECAGDARVAIVPASVPGMPARKGLTAIMSAAESPFLEQAKHLASFGAQAALVAGSPYYQYLVGRVLGYTEANIDAHVRSRGGRLTTPVVREAEKDLEALSESHGGSLPWREATSGSSDRVAASGFFFLDAGTDASLEKSAGGKRGGRRGKKKKTSTVKSVADAESMFGGRGKKKK